MLFQNYNIYTKRMRTHSYAIIIYDYESSSEVGTNERRTLRLPPCVFSRGFLILFHKTASNSLIVLNDWM